MLKAIIFDFNGVILNDEPIHFRAMRDVVARLGITLTEQMYLNKYLPLDDESCLTSICADHGVKLSADQKRDSLVYKAARYTELLGSEYPLFRGAAEFVHRAAERYPLALASGARRDEIDRVLSAADLARYFKIVVAAQDFTLGKPHPESFLLALKHLNRQLDMHPAITPGECLVIEDAIGGVRGALAAGMKCMAVSTSYPKEKLTEANRVVASLEEVDVNSLQRIFEEPS